MSTDSPTDGAGAAASVQRLFRNTVVAVSGALSRRDGRVSLSVSGLAYFLLYLAGLRHLGFGPSGYEVSVVSNPLVRAFRQVGPFQWEPIALVVVGPVELLVAPLNMLLGAVLAALVGLNLAVSIVAWRGPSACRLGPGAGAMSGLPGLLSGFACCGPTILLVVGIQASAGLLSLFQWLLPLTVVALLGTLLWVGSRVETAQQVA
ncbi:MULTISPECIES: hypothetical protein [Haloarcula]|uniref:Uncharacterized protein n=1 Tax=Haloarcula marismortui (strain ATCC 43049 / DSM 3752 / JCM 8966 / VKM B-1809) TaxID=272569 RepID=Q5V2Z0_HALMA|nr:MULTISPECIES: hypothetical protein [Haloarcula]AAV46112.1 unknown [Haloarcula marismortui ATCC 43049]NHX38079.1 hypothetical protein [Haloarcula sp. R1-2]QCP90870.1 hypothetical protein E6P14_08335 [Haloarcula marismortui ATCC 43049]